MDPVTLLGLLSSIASLAHILNRTVKIGNDIWNSKEERKKFEDDLACVQQIYDLLKDATKDMKPSEEGEEWFQAIGSSVKTLLKTLDEIHRKLGGNEENKYKKKILALRWHAQKPDVKDSFATIRTSCGLISIALELRISKKQEAHMLISQSHLDLTEQFRDSQTAANTAILQANATLLQTNGAILEHQLKQKQEEDREGIINWLSKLNFQARQRELFDNSAPETGQWFIEHPVFKCWKRDELEEVRGYGDAGTGKTVLASIIIDHLQKNMTTSSSKASLISLTRPNAVIYAFLEKKQASVHTKQALLGSFLKQLLQQETSSMPEGLKDAWQQAKGVDPKLEDLMKFLKREIENYERVFLVIDALDEAEPRIREFFERDIREILPENLRVLSMKRQLEERNEDVGTMTCSNCGENEIDICYHCMDDDEDESHFDLCEDCHAKGIPCPRDPSHIPYLPSDVEVTISVPDDVIREWVTSKIKTQMPEQRARASRNGRRPDPRRQPSHKNAPLLAQKCKDINFFKEVVEFVVTRADGKFLFADLFLESLMKQLNWAGITSTMATLVKPGTNLDDAFGHFYKQAMIDKIMYQRPEQRSLALKVLSILTCAHRNLTLAELKHALVVQIGSRQFDLEDNDYSMDAILGVTNGLVTIDKRDDQYVRLFHLTFLDYLRRNRTEWFPNAEAEMAKICLTYLSFDIFSKPCPKPEDFAVKEKEYKFISYALLYWGDHVRDAGEDVVDDAVRYLEDRSRVAAYIQAAWVVDTREHERWDSRKGVGALHICAWFNISHLIAPLLKQSLNIDEGDGNYDQTPLMYACRRGNIETAKCLLEHGASVNKVSAKGHTAMLEAVLKNNIMMLNLLLQHHNPDEEIDVNIPNPEVLNRTPLMAAVISNYLKIAEAILSSPKVLVNAQDSKGHTALSLAASFGFIYMVEAILSVPHVNINLTDENGYSALMLASEANHAEIVGILLSHGADAELKDSRGGTAVLRAVEKGRINVLRKLVEVGVNLRGIDESGRTLLHAVAEDGHLEIMEFLKNQQLDVNVSDQNRMTPLHAVCRSGHIDIAHILLELGADCTLEDNFGRNPYLVALQYGHTALAETCRPKGPGSGDGTTPKELPIWSLVTLRKLDLITAAIKSRSSELTQKEPCTNNSVLHCAIINNSNDGAQAATLLRELLQCAPNLLNEADIYKATPLHTAAIYRNMPAMKVLLSYKPQLDLADSRSLTPLLIAYTNSDFDMAILLISAGANVRPLRRVMKNKLLLEAVKLKNVEAIQALLDAGADVLAQDEYGRSATVLVRAIGDDEEVKGEILRILRATASVAVKHSSTLKMKQRQDTINVKVKALVDGIVIPEEEEEEEEEQRDEVMQVKGEGGITVSTQEILGEIPREEKVKMMFQGLDAKDIPIRTAFPMPGERNEEMELQQRFEDLLLSR